MIFYVIVQSAFGGVQEGAFDADMWKNMMSILREINDSQTVGHDDSDNAEVCWNHLA